MRILGLDIGSKTIGIALTDEAGIAAHPHSVLARKGIVADTAAVAALVRANAVTAIVVGLPLELSGRVGHRAKRVRLLTAAIRAALDPAIELVEQDERFTTSEANRVLLDADVSRARRREVIDQQAAALILQSYLATRAREIANKIG